MNSSNALFNLNIERAVLSSIIFEPDIFSDISLKIGSEVFFNPFHKELFDILINLEQKEKPFDEDFIEIELRKNGKFNRNDLLAVMCSTPISNISSYIEQLLQLSNKRKLQILSANIHNDAINFDKTPDDILSTIQESLEDIDGDVFELDLIIGDHLSKTKPLFHCKNWLPIPSSALTLISADGGVGKTWISLQLAIRYVVEHKFEKKAFLWLSEDPEGIISERLEHVISFLGYTNDIKKIVHCIYFTTKEPPALVVKKSFKTSEISPTFYKIKKQLKNFDFIILDPLSDFMGADENDNSEASTFMKPFKRWSAEEGKSIIFLHHNTKGDGKGSGGFRGATTIRTSVRIAYEMDFVRDVKGTQVEDNQEIRSIKLTKDNWGGGTYLKVGIGSKFKRQIVPKNNAFEILYEDTQINFEMPKI